MPRLQWLLLSVALLLPVLPSTPALAQTTSVTFVTGTNAGAEGNPCTRDQPCKTLQTAFGKTDAGGEIFCLDAGSYGGISNINKAISINCEGAAGSVASTFTINAGSNDVVYLRGLDINGLGSGVTGITFNSGAALIIENSTIRNWSGTNGLGINFQPSGVATLTLTGTSVANNGNASSGGGVRIATQGSGFARASLTRSLIDKNYIGLAAIGSGANASAEILDSTISHNKSIGLVAVGSGAVIAIGSSMMVGNASAATSGNVLSYANNQIRGNNPDTTPSSAGGLR